MEGQEGVPAAATFAFVDLAGFTALTEAHGDAEALAAVRRFRARVEAVLDDGDRLVKMIGDAAMVAFGSPAACIAGLRALLCAADPDDGDPGLVPRAGAHHGTAVEVEGDYIGSAVNLAARVAGQARAGELVVTEAVAYAARDAGAVVTHLGPVELRNVSGPVDLYDVRFDAAAGVEVDPVCQMRVPLEGPAAIALEWSGHRLHFCGLPCVSRFAASPELYLARR